MIGSRIAWSSSPGLVTNSYGMPLKAGNDSQQIPLFNANQN